jgi:hypothetical protein
VDSKNEAQKMSDDPCSRCNAALVPTSELLISSKQVNKATLKLVTKEAFENV